MTDAQAAKLAQDALGAEDPVIIKAALIRLKGHAFKSSRVPERELVLYAQGMLEARLGNLATATVALSLALVGASALPPFESLALAADPIPAAELMKPDALPEMSMGNDKASVTVIEYASMTCPHCAAFQEKTFPELKKRSDITEKARKDAAERGYWPSRPS